MPYGMRIRSLANFVVGSASSTYYPIRLRNFSLPHWQGTVSNSKRALDNSTCKIQFTLFLNFESYYNQRITI